MPRRGKTNIQDLLIGRDDEIVWWAAQGGDVEMILYAQEHLKAPLDTPNEHGATPFYIACACGKIDIVVMLLTEKVDMETPCGGALNATPFWAACAGGHIEVVEFLAGKLSATTTKVNILTPNEHGVTPMDIARVSGHAQIVKYIQMRLDALGTADALRKQSMANPYGSSRTLGSRGGSRGGGSGASPNKPRPPDPAKLGGPRDAAAAAAAAGKAPPPPEQDEGSRGSLPRLFGGGTASVGMGTAGGGVSLVSHDDRSLVSSIADSHTSSSVGITPHVEQQRMAPSNVRDSVHESQAQRQARGSWG